MVTNESIELYIVPISLRNLTPEHSFSFFLLSPSCVLVIVRNYQSKVDNGYLEP